MKNLLILLAYPAIGKYFCLTLRLHNQSKGFWIKPVPKLKTRIFPISVSCLSFAFLLFPYKQADSTAGSYPDSHHTILKSVVNTDSLTEQSLIDEATVIYDSINLGQAGLAKKAFEYAWKGYKNLLEKNIICRGGVLTICDFSQSSRRKRMYLLDLENYKLLVQTYVAHGRNSGAEYADRFSNKPESLQSSLGFYVTGSTYYGGHGLALKIDGLEPGINDEAEDRKIVIHGSEYVGPDFLRFNRFMGRSFGCPAVPQQQTMKIINTIKNGSCLFIYHPTRKYIDASKILNG
jgi:hypothetical protein